MSGLNATPELADAYVDGLATGMNLAETYREDDAYTPLSASRTVRRLVILLLIVSIAGWLYGLLQMTGVIPASIANAAAPASVSMLEPAVHTAAALQTTPAQRTCAAFATWEKHPGARHLDALVTASFKAPGKYLGADVGQLYADVRGGGNTDLDRQYLYEDCHDGYGL